MVLTSLCSQQLTQITERNQNPASGNRSSSPIRIDPSGETDSRTALTEAGARVDLDQRADLYFNDPSNLLRVARDDSRASTRIPREPLARPLWSIAASSWLD